MMTMVQAEDYPPLLRRSGLWFEELTDISEPTLRRTFIELSARITESAPDLAADHGDELVDQFNPGDLIDVTEFGHLLVVAVRPRTPETQESDGESAVGDLYDRINDVTADAMGGFLHGGYWEGPDDPSTDEEAGIRLTDFVSDRLRLTPGDRVLDVGCGNGKATTHMARRHGVSVTGITLSPHQVRQATDLAAATGLAGSTDFQVHDMLALPFPEASFDAAYAIEAVCHAQNRTDVFAQLARVLRPGGLLTVTDLVLLRPLEGDDHRALIDATIKNFHQGPMLLRGEYEACVRAAGLEVVEFLDISEFLRPSFRVTGRNFARFRETLEELVNESELHFMVEDLARFSDISELGYAVVTARKPGAAGGRD
ncbi:methyltransferase domain-containing protein [Streptomyces sp. NPDC051173]|uniref:SAM-dependent methyltransferase n=1 Tax=Streptomyces sp. NPDC051173 TaxID=3155164 RepID=UPI00344F429E